MSKVFSELEKKIKENAQKYYTDGSQELSDAEFDSLIDDLRQTNPQSPVLTPGWGYSPEEQYGQKCEHKYAFMSSLDKCRNYSELPQRYHDTNCMATLKLDGMSVILYYESGNLQKAITRGDGRIGIDITDKVEHILTDGELHMHDTFTGAVRGELVMSLANFDKYKQLHPEAKNPRNSVAGILNAKQGYESDLKFIDCVVYTIIAYDATYMQIFSYNNVLDWLGKHFNNSVAIYYMNVTLNTFQSRMNNFRDKYFGIYPCDGIVLCRCIQLNPIDTDNLMYNVYYDSLAYKFPSEVAETTVEAIEWNMSKSNYAIPKIRVSSVNISGADVQYCSGFNALYILDNQIGPGAKVEITRSGEVIPYITRVIEPVTPSILETCPVCRHPLSLQGVHLVCENPKCDNIAIQDLLVWITTLQPYDGLGETLILQFLNDLKDSGAFDSLCIEEFMKMPPESIKLTRDGSVNRTQMHKFYDMYYKLCTNEHSLSTALQALNIPRLGDVTSKKLSQYPELVDKLIDIASQDNRDYTTVLPVLFDRIGDANSASIIKYGKKFRRLSYIKIKPTDNSKKIPVAITGKLSMKRADFESMLSEHGFQVTELTKDTKYLITNTPDSNSSKNAKADKYNITKISEVDFIKQFIH